MAVTDPAAGPLVPRPARVLGWWRETPDTVTLSVEANGIAWRPGQFNMLYAFGVGEIPISISGDPAQSDRVVHTVRQVGMVSAALGRLRRGHHIGIRGPYGAGWPLAEVRGGDVVVVAGGVGMAPLRSAMYVLRRHREDYGRVTLVCGARTPELLLFRAELERWRNEGLVDVMLTVDAAASGWRGEVGVVTAQLPRASFDPERAVAMICGPEVMMRFTITELRRLGMRETAMWMSIERNMHCAVGLCGHCQFGPAFVCREGPVFRVDTMSRLLAIREL